MPTRNIRLRLITLLFSLAAVSACEADNMKNNKQHLHGVYLATAKVAPEQKSPSCPDGICPGMGNNFYLPAINAISLNTGGNIFFNNRKLGDCVLLSTATQGQRSFVTADSMQQFISNTMSQVDLSGSYKTAALTVKGSAQAMTGSSSDITSTFHSTYMDITAVTHTVDFQQSSKCFSQDNIDSKFLTKFEALAPIDTGKVNNVASWQPYVDFLQSQGSHIMLQQHIGSRFQQWQSSTVQSSDIDNTLKAKACAEVEGVTGSGGGWSVNGCAAYSKDEKQKALKMSSKSQTIVLGGTNDTRAALLQGQFTKAQLDAFIGSADQGNQPIRFIFKPIWELLSGIYSPLCASAGKDSKACANLQRAVNLQAAYEGWTAIGCALQNDNKGHAIQAMGIAGTTSLGINTYQCLLSKTGCRSDDSCHLGGAGSVCYCYGPECIDTGERISGTDLYRNAVRGNQSGSYDQGVNKSCYYHFLAHCNCHKNWAGGLPARTIYLQSAPQ